MSPTVSHISMCGLPFQVLHFSSWQQSPIFQGKWDFCARTKNQQQQTPKTHWNALTDFWLSCAHLIYLSQSLWRSRSPPWETHKNQMFQQDPGNISLPNLHSDWFECLGHSHSDTTFTLGHVWRGSILSSFNGNLPFHPNPPAAWISADDED